MAEIIKVIELADGTLTNMVDKNSKLSVNYKPVTTWYDGTAMDASKVDGDLYTKKGSKYYRKVIDKDGELFLEKDTMAQMRALTPLEILYLKASVYKGVKLNGYYVKGDTPAPIEYFLSSTTNADDGGSVIEVGGIKLEHEFVGNINPVYFGYNENILDISPILENIYAKYINIEFDADIQINLSYFNFDKDNTKILFNNSIIVYNGEVVEGINRVVDVSGNKIKFYDFNVSTDIEISRGVVITGDDFYSNYTRVKGSFFYGFEMFGDNIRVDIFKGEEGRYSQLRLFNSKNINSVSFGRIFLTGSLVKGFLVNGKGEVDSIYIGEYFNEMEDGLVEGSNGFLVDPDLPTDTKNIKSLYINRFENRGSESGAFKCQNISSLYINEYYDYRKGRAYSSSYAFRADYVDNLTVNKMYVEDRILMNNSSGNFGNIVCMDDLLAVRLNAFMWVTSTETRCRIASIKCLDSVVTDPTRYIVRFEATNPNSYLEIEDIERTGDRGIIGFFSGTSNTHPNTISLGKKASAIRGGLWASFYGGVVQRTPTVYMTGNIPSSGNYKIGDIIYLLSPDKFIGRVCTSISPLTFSPFGEIGVDIGKLKSGTTANRPEVTTVGFQYYNTTIGGLEVWNGTSWINPVGNATTSSKGLVNQSAKVDDVSTTPPSPLSAQTVTTIEEAQTAINNLVTMVNAMQANEVELKAKLNAKLVADRASGQQSTT